MSLLCPECRQSGPADRCAEHGLFRIEADALADLDEAPLLGHALEDRYVLRRLLGGGGMGVVYSGYDRRLDRTVAVKTLHASLTATRQDRQRFEHEAKAMSRLRSNHTVTAFDFGVVGKGPLRGTAFIVMEQVDGESLAACIARGPLSPTRAATILDQVARSLDEAHALGIIHRDLKPQNILLARTPDGRIEAKVIDFGVARIEDAVRTRSGILLGTPQYMAPEQCNPARDAPLDARVDIYALGILMYEMLTGVRPFDARDPLAVVVKQLTATPPRLPGAAEDAMWARLERIVHGALAKDPADRPASATSLGRQVNEALAFAGRGPTDSVTATAPDATAPLHRGGMAPRPAAVDVIPTPPRATVTPDPTGRSSGPHPLLALTTAETAPPTEDEPATDRAVQPPSSHETAATTPSREGRADDESPGSTRIDLPGARATDPPQLGGAHETDQANVVTTPLSAATIAPEPSSRHARITPTPSDDAQTLPRVEPATQPAAALGGTHPSSDPATVPRGVSRLDVPEPATRSRHRPPRPEPAAPDTAQLTGEALAMLPSLARGPRRLLPIAVGVVSVTITLTWVVRTLPEDGPSVRRNAADARAAVSARAPDGGVRETAGAIQPPSIDDADGGARQPKDAALEDRRRAARPLVEGPRTPAPVGASAAQRKATEAPVARRPVHDVLLGQAARAARRGETAAALRHLRAALDAAPDVRAMQKRGRQDPALRRLARSHDDIRRLLGISVRSSIKRRRPSKPHPRLDAGPTRIERL